MTDPITTIDKNAIATFRSLASDCLDLECQAAMAPVTLTALLDRLESAEAKLAAIGQLSPTDYDDREQLLCALFRILRGQVDEDKEMES